MFTETARAIAPWYSPMLGLSAVGGMICFFGIWMMRKWGVYAYIALTVTVQIVLLATRLWTPPALILPLVFIVVLSIYLPRMR
jgi:hypothetical protein